MYPCVDYVFVDRAGVRISEVIEAVHEAARQEMDALKQIDFLRDVSLQTEIRPGRPLTRSAVQPISQM